MRYFPLCAALVLLASCAPAARQAENSTDASVDAVAVDDSYAESAGPGDAVDAVDAVADAEEPAAMAAPKVEAPGAAAPGGAAAPPFIAKSLDYSEKAAPDLVFCAPVRRTMSAAACQAFKDQQASLETGVAAFTPPSPMTRGQTVRVRFAIGSESDRAATVAAAGGDGDTGVVPVKIGRFMRATLSGANFTITPIGEPDRDLGASSSELWEWDVVPQSAGNHVLQVRVETFAEGENGERTRVSLYRSPPISVQVVVSKRDRRLDELKQIKEETSVWQSLVEALTGWFGAAAALLLALSLVVWRLRNFGKKPESESDSGESPPPSPPPE